MNYLKVFSGIFFILAVSRLIPHPPNFTSLIALSFYVPTFFGRKYLFALIISFFITDIIIGFHNTIIFTYGSVVIIGIISKYFKEVIFSRILGALLGAIIFFIITNFGVWTSGFYTYSFNGLIECYFLALPFFSFSLISTIVYALIFELLYILNKFFNIIKVQQ